METKRPALQSTSGLAHSRPRVGKRPATTGSTNAVRDEPAAFAASARIAGDLPGKPDPHAILTLQRWAGNRAVSRMIGEQRAQSAPPTVTPVVIQRVPAVWVQADGREVRFNLTRIQGKIYEDRATNERYLWTGRRNAYGAILVVPAASEKQKPYADLTKQYKDWKKANTSNVTIETPYGPVSGRHNRGAPWISSREEDFDDAALGDTYTEFIRGLRGLKQGQAKRKAKVTDAEIAKDLLSAKNDAIRKALQKRAAAMITATVYLAEEWRKQGAVKIFRGILRRIAGGKGDFDSLPERFEFVLSADAGRRQVGRFQDRYERERRAKKRKFDLLDKAEEKIYGSLSDIEPDDLSSDDDTREEKKLKKRRLFAEKHENS